MLKAGLKAVDEAPREAQYDWKKDLENNPSGTKRVERFLQLYDEKNRQG